MPTTSNFGWTTPADTDLVKDGAAAIRTLGNGIDTSLVDLKGGTTNQVLAKNSNTDLDFKWVADATGIPATIFDAKGDIIAATAADTADRLAVGTNGQVLTADSTTATGLKWASPSAGDNWTLLNAGGTATTSGNTVTVSGISGKDKLMIFCRQHSSTAANNTMSIRFNSDSANNYYTFGNNFYWPAGYNAGNYVGIYSLDDRIYLGSQSGDAASTVSGGVMISGCNSAGVKAFTVIGGGTPGSSHSQDMNIRMGYYNSSSTISSVSIVCTGTFDAGTIFVYANS